jgi:hypothetical protein
MPATETLLQGATQVTSSLSTNYTAGGGTIAMAAALVDHGGGAVAGPFEILVGRNRPASERRYFVATPSGSNLTVTASPGYTDNQNFASGDLIDVISAWETQRRLRAFATLHTHTGGVDGAVLPVGTPATWAVGAITQAASTPAFTTNSARQITIGKFALIEMSVTFTGAGTAGSAIVVTLPAGLTLASSGASCIGSFTYNDISAAIYTGSTQFATTTTLQFIASGNSNYLGAAPNFAIANGDSISFTIMVELA